MEKIRIDMRERTPEEQAMYDKQAQLMFKLNHTMPRTEEYMSVLKELLGDRIGEGSYVAAPISGAAIDKLVIGKNVFINSNFLAMARGGIVIGDNVAIAANVQLLSNNHDPYDRDILTCKPIHIGMRVLERKLGILSQKAPDHALVFLAREGAGGIYQHAAGL